MPVLDLILSRLPATLELTLAAVLGATLLGVPLGMYAGYKPDGVALEADHGAFDPRLLGADLLGRPRADPHLRGHARLASGGRARRDGRRCSASNGASSRSTACAICSCPRLNLALFKLAMMIRLARAGTREVMLTDTVKFARAAGESRMRRSCRRHVLRLISIPLVTVFGLEFCSTLAFAVVTETIFSWPGIGKLIIDSISSLDRPVMVAYLMLVAFLFIMINFLVDIAYAALDPRLRVRRA